MAPTTLSLPSPFLFDYLLASSWAWLALCLATLLATAFRALKILLPGRRVKALPSTAPESASLPSPSCVAPPHVNSHFCCSHSATDFSSSASRRRTRCKSTSSLRTLNRNGEDLLRSGLGLVSSVLDTDILPSLRKIASGSKIFCGQSKLEEKDRCFAQKDRGLMHNLERKSDIVEDSRDQKVIFVPTNDFSCRSSFKEEQISSNDEDTCFSRSWLPAWAYSVREPWQNHLFHLSPPSHSEGRFRDAYHVWKAPPCFENQFGWEKLLESRLGLSWNCIVDSIFGITRCKLIPEPCSPKVVKKWTGPERQLLKSLRVDEGYALSLDFAPEVGMACVGGALGEVMLWDVGSKACVNTVATKGRPIYTLSMNHEHGFTVIDDGGGIALWDHRSSPPPSVLGNIVSIDTILGPVSSLKSRGHGLCIAQPDGMLSMYDMRILHNQPISSGKRSQLFADVEDGMPVWLLGMLTLNGEEDFCDEEECSPGGNGALAKKGAGSFVSRFASFLQGMYSSTP